MQLLCPVWMAPFLQVLFLQRLAFCQKQSCVRPVYATHMAAGPDGFHQPSPIPHIEQHSVPDKARGVLVLGLTIFPSLHWSCNSVFLSDRVYAVLTL